MIKAIAREAFFIKKADLPKDVREELIEKYTFRFYDDKACQPCEFLPDRHCEVCQQCGAYSGGAQLAKPVKIKDKSYFTTPLGDEAGLRRLLDSHHLNVKVVDRQIDNPMTKRIKFIGTLKPFQAEAVDVMIKKQRGVIKAPPRSGKTVLSTAAVCRIGQKTMILAAQKEWLDGFHETFVGSGTQEALTNCSSKKIGYPKKYEDFLKYDVCLVTYQTFNSERGKKLLKKIVKLFGCVVIDECFPAGTRVVTNKGPVNIEDIVANFRDYTVLSYNHSSNTYEWKPVISGQQKTTAKRLLRFTDENGKTFTCTENHRIWSEDRQEYVYAKDLILGESLKTAKVP